MCELALSLAALQCASRWNRASLSLRETSHFETPFMDLAQSLGWNGSVPGWVRRWYRYHPLPEELGVRLMPHPAQAACLKCKGSDRTPFDRCSKVTFTRLGIQLFPWMSARLLVGETRHPATSAPFQVGYNPIRQVMNSLCLSAVGIRFLAVLSREGIGSSLRWAYCRWQTLSGFPRSA
jgi:hypothetical protein